MGYFICEGLCDNIFSDYFKTVLQMKKAHNLGYMCGIMVNGIGPVNEVNTRPSL